MTTPTSLTNGPPLGLARLRAPARFTGEGVTPVRASSTRSGSPLRMHARLQIDYRICGRREGGHSCPFVSSDGGMRRVSVRINQSETLRINRHKAGSRRESHGYSLLGKGRFTFVPRQHAEPGYCSYRILCPRERWVQRGTCASVRRLCALRLSFNAKFFSSLIDVLLAQSRPASDLPSLSVGYSHRDTSHMSETHEHNDHVPSTTPPQFPTLHLAAAAAVGTLVPERAWASQPLEPCRPPPSS